jgi:eukaryotic-like serine/threonine-protein kinase
VPSADDTDIAMIETRLGTLAISRQDLVPAIEHYNQAIELLEANLGADHPLLLPAVLNLGVAHYSRFELEDAERLFHRALSIQEASRPGPHPDLVTILTNLGNVETSRVRYLEALGYYERARDMAVQLFGPDDVQVGIALVNVAMIRHELGQYEESRAAYEHTLDIWEREMPKHSALAFPLTGLGAALLDLGRPADALPHLERALEIRTSATPAERDLGDTERHLARALWETGGDRKRARALAEAALARFVALGEIAGEPVRELETWLAGHHESG